MLIHLKLFGIVYSDKIFFSLYKGLFDYWISLLEILDFHSVLLKIWLSFLLITIIYFFFKSFFINKNQEIITLKKDFPLLDSFVTLNIHCLLSKKIVSPFLNSLFFLKKNYLFKSARKIQLI